MMFGRFLPTLPLPPIAVEHLASDPAEIAAAPILFRKPLLVNLT